MKKRIIAYIVIFQLVIISIVVYQIYKKKTSVLGQNVSVNPVKSTEQIFPKVNGLKYFYEPKPDSTHIINLEYENTNGPERPVYKINSDGLNQLVDYSTEKPQGVFRIMTLGDSFTFGFNVNTEDNYPSQLQNMLDIQCKNNFQVINLGVGGYDIRYVVERYKLRGQKYNPDLIIWFVIDDDLLRITELLRPKFLKHYAEMKKSGQFELSKPWRLARDEILKELGEDEVLKKQEIYIQDMNKYFKGRIIISNFFHGQEKYKSILKRLVDKNNKWLYYDGIPNISLNNKTALPDFHPSPLGHKLIAESVFNYLKTSRLISCR